MQQLYLTSGRARQRAPVPVFVRWTAVVVTGALGALASACENTTTASGGTVAAIEIAPESLSLSPGATTPLTARVLGESGSPIGGQVFWAVENERVARVSSQGIVTAVAAGRTQVAASRSGMSAVATVVVSALPPVLVRVNPNAAQVTVGGKTTLQAEVFDVSGAKLSGHSVTWSSANKDVASVSATGIVTGIAQGTALINAATAGLTGSAVVAVQPVPVSSVSVTPTAANVQVGRTVLLRAVLRDAAGNLLTGRAVSWSSGNALRATVLPTGLVTGISKGSVTITATSEGKSANAAISVR